MRLIDRWTGYLNRDQRLLIHIISLLIVGFILLSLLVSLLPPTGIDIEFSEEVQEHHSPLLSPIMRAVSWFGNGLNSVIVTIVAAGLFFLARYRPEAIFTLATLLASVVTYVLKAIVNRPRPTTNLVEFVIDTKLKSFPSGHVAFYVVFFGFLAFLMYRLDQISNVLRLSIAFFSLLLIFSVPFSRVYLGAHWFTDVLAGFILGLLYLILLVHFYSRASPTDAG